MKSRRECPAAYRTATERGISCKRLKGPCIFQYYCRDEGKFLLSASSKNCTVPETKGEDNAE